MIKAIDIGADAEMYKNKYNDKMQYLNKLDKVNIFIGENNSGKSRLLRYLLTANETKDLSGPYNDSDINNFKSAKKELFYYIKNYNIDADRKIELSQDIIDLDDSNFYCEVSEYIESLGISSESIKNSNTRTYFSNIKSYLNDMYRYISANPNGYGSRKINDLNITYIPILRGIESFDNYYELIHNEELDNIVMNEKQRKAIDEYRNNAKHVYLNKISKAYGINNKNIFTAEDLFDDVKNKLLGEEKDRNFVRDFEKFISEEFYNGQGFTIIPQVKKGYLNVKIGNGAERAIHELGDGIKQIITIFYKMFEKRNETSIFLIEEPELNLHPGYQRQFIEILQNNKLFSKQQFFITTHSNHMIDSCLDYNNTSIYKFINIEKKNEKFQILNTTSKDVEILEMLGVYNTSVFMANCSIWVEGISDKILISKYLEVYLKSKNESRFKEDMNYSFVEYGGNNITHWSFLDTDDISTINASSISNRCFIILDNDNDAPGKTTRKKNLKEIFKERYLELSVREIENTISKNVLEKTLYPNGEVKYKKEYLEKEYASKETYMGRFIDEHYELSKKYGTKETGTIRNKLEFSKKIAANINDINDLSIQSKKLCDKIYEFIKKSNYK